jgi:hypothetical protein
MAANRKRQLTLLAGMFLLLGSAMSARADFAFNFNSLASGANSAAIATYMDNVIGCANCVTVTGGVADRTYSGEGFAVGPGGASRTLGNTDGAIDNSSLTAATTNDTFISNTNDSSSHVDANGNPGGTSDQVTINFINGFSISGKVSFDYQIFPDGGCASSTNCSGGLPDFAFAANGVTIFPTVGAFPSSMTNGTSLHSPKSGGGTEGSAQLIGTWSGTVSNATKLEFIDWPATIGFDNLKVATPEPKGGVFFLGALALAAIVGTRLRRGFAKS